MALNTCIHVYCVCTDSVYAEPQLIMKLSCAGSRKPDQGSERDTIWRIGRTAAMCEVSLFPLGEQSECLCYNDSTEKVLPQWGNTDCLWTVVYQ